MTKTPVELIQMLRDLNEATEKLGLKVNISKTNEPRTKTERRNNYGEYYTRKWDTRLFLPNAKENRANNFSGK